jgi:hypothetical protein
MTYRNRLTGGGCKPAYAAEPGNRLVVNDTLKGSNSCQVRIQEMNASEHCRRSVETCLDDIKTGVWTRFRDKCRGYLFIAFTVSGV